MPTRVLDANDAERAVEVRDLCRAAVGDRVEAQRNPNVAAHTLTIVDRAWITSAFGAHADAVKLRIVAISAEPSLAEDLTQETFVVAWRGRERFASAEAGDSPAARAWLLGIATNLARNARRARVRNWLRQRLLRARGSSETDAATPESNLEARQRAADMFAAASRLPPEQGEAFGLRAIEGLSLQEASEILGVPVSTVSYRAREAERKLRAAWKEES